MKTHLAVLLIGLSLAGHSSAQPYRLENYRHALADKEKIKGFQRDTGYINVLLKFATSFYAVNPDSMLFYSQKASGYAKSVHYERGEAEGLSVSGYFYNIKGDYAQMLSYYQQAQSLAEKVNDKQLAANMIRNIGQFYINTGKEEEALQQYKKAYGIMMELHDSVGKAYLLVDMASIYYLRHDYDKVLELYHTAMDAVNDPNGYVAAFVRVDIASALCEKKQFKEALPYLLPSLQYYERTNDKMGRMNTLVIMANAYQGLAQTDLAIENAQASFALADEMKHREGMQAASESLANLYEIKGDYRNSLKYYKLFKIYSDSLFNEETRKKTVELQTKFVYEKKEALLQETHANHIRMLQLEVGMALMAALLLCILVVFFLSPKWLRKYAKFREPPKEVETYEQKSITYL